MSEQNTDLVGDEKVPVRFAALPLIVQLTAIIAPFMGWLMIEEWLIDRHGHDRYLPFYHVGNLCLYDLTVATVLGLLFFRFRRAD